MSGETSIEDISPSRFYDIFKWDESGAIIVSNPVLTRHPMNPTFLVSQRKHICEQCSYSTNDTGDFERHLCAHSRMQYFSCIKCGTPYTQFSSLRQHEQLMHMEENHNLCPTGGENLKNRENFKDRDCRHQVSQPLKEPEKKHKCEQCSYSTNYSSHLKRRRLTHTGEKPYQCPDCGEDFTTETNMRRHHLRIHTGERLSFCRVCGASFSNQNTLSRHERRQHTGERPESTTESERKHKCDKCFYSTNHAGNLTKHRLTHTGEKPHQCPHCIEAFKTESYLRRHLRIHTGERLSFCKVCGASFSNQNTLSRHERRWHTGGRSESPIESERKYKCEQCDYSTTNADNVKKHRLTHTGEKPHLCPNCNGGFATKGNLQSHLSLHTVQRHVSCSVCGASFSEIESLHRHESRHFRRSDAPTESERQLRYGSCPYSTNRSNDNELTHTGEKPYKCPVCPRAFTRKETLEYHVRNHTRERLFSCHICQIKFTRLELLRQHERTHFEHRHICSTCMNDFPDPETFLMHECEKYVIEDSKIALLGA